MLANVLIPSIAGHVIVMLVLLAPIACIEGIVLARRHDLDYGSALHLSLRANLWSTFVGLPVGYMCALLGLIPVGLFSALLPEKIRSVVGSILINALGHGGTAESDLNELGFFLGTLLVMIPYYLVTLRLERNCVAALRPELDSARLTTTVRIMNDITYGLLAIPVVTGAVLVIARKW